MKTILLTFIALISVDLSFANDAPLVLIGNSASPIISNDIVMESEKIEVILDKYEATVKCTFKFLNKGDSKTVLMGFPEILGYLETSGISDFTTNINGIQKEITKVSGDKDDKWDNWFVWEVEFGKDEQVFVINTYKTGRYMSTSKHIFEYIVETGAGWTDSISHSEIIVTLGDVQFEDIADIYPKNYVIDSNSIKWDFYNFEPSDKNNISIKYLPSENPRGEISLNDYKLIESDSSYILEKEKLENISNLIEEKKYEECIRQIKIFNKTYNIDKSSYTYYYTVKCLIESYSQTNKINDVIKLVKSNIDIISNPKFELAKLYEKLGDYNNAIRYYNLAKREFKIEEHQKLLDSERFFYSENVIENYVIPFLKNEGLNSFCDYKIKTLENKK